MPQAKLDHCDTDLACIRKDLTNFNQINKDFLGVVRSKMAHFDDTINEANDKLDAKIKEHWSSSQHVFTNFSNTNVRIVCNKYYVLTLSNPQNCEKNAVFDKREFVFLYLAHVIDQPIFPIPNH